MWQKAKILAGDFAGGELWIQATPPETVTCIKVLAPDSVRIQPPEEMQAYTTNLYDDEEGELGQWIVVEKDAVELLSDFCDKPPRVTDSWRRAFNQITT